MARNLVVLLFFLYFVDCCEVSITNDRILASSEMTVHPPCLSKNISVVNTPASLPSICVQHPEFLSVFDFPTSSVIEIDCAMDNPVEWMRLSKPMILKRCQFFETARKWNIQYLLNALVDEYAISRSDSRKFLYYDSTVDYTNYEKDHDWIPPYTTQYDSFQEFLDIAEELRRVGNGSSVYFRTLLDHHDLNTSLKYDLENFNYTWLLETVFELGWSSNVLSMLFVGMPDVVTSLHYDLMQNIFIQLHGKKRFILFSPDHFNKLYPYPVGHPHDRQSMVDIDSPDYDKFPNFRHIEGEVAILEPGDVLYLPTSWWHHVESNRDHFTVSMNFWFQEDLEEKILRKMRESSVSDKATKLTPSEELCFKRYIESLVFNVTRNTAKVKEVFQQLLTGRYDES